MGDALPAQIVEQLNELPEFQPGVYRIAVELVCGVRLNNVLVSQGRLEGILGLGHVPFDAAEVVHIEDQSRRPIPPSR